MPITRLQPLETKCQSAQPIPTVGIGTRQIKHQIRAEAREQLCQCIVERTQVVGIAATVRECHIQITDFLGKWEILVAMQ